MATLDFTKYSLYRWRYIIGYTLVGLLLAAVLLFAGTFLPGALSAPEMSSVVVSESLRLNDPSTLAVANLPYHLLQAGFFQLFGISVFTIKLPSLIFALLSALGLIVLLRRWFKPNIAVMASLIAISTSQFLYIAQLGAPNILNIFWPIALLLLGTQITRVKKLRFLWKALFATTAALSLYTPFSIYALLAIGLSIALHPHLRSIVRRLSKVRLAIISALLLVLVAPLIFFIFKDPSLSLTLIGAPASWPPSLLENIITLGRQYLLFWEPNNGTSMTPVYGLGSALLIIIGLYRLIRTRETTRSYLIIIWLLCLTPVLILNPGISSVTFVPSVLLLAAGLTSLIGYWYRLFPRNPYARIAGLVPIIILVSALIISGLARYAYGYSYNPAAVARFSSDLSLLPADTKQLVVAEDEKAFWSAVARYKEGIEVVTEPTAPRFVLTRAALRDDFAGYTIVRIITNPMSEASNRLYIYQKAN